LQQLLTINLKWGSDHEKFQKFLISLFIWDLFTVVKGQGFENSIVDEVFSVYKIDQASGSCSYPPTFFKFLVFTRLIRLLLSMVKWMISGCRFQQYLLLLF